ncbi:hypothetical protein O7626_40855 [Micromonospora sp. WMMD1102]|uniref:hypothetical protein n=1 Tax=Micromonospora sp. WMMD1102 TaxID=3016105 RepID=UPI00241501E1|nr:hypothetical protein [Micromonospora sp. WMMD1102]MDG4790352.1 hypothetical protein [Micromonospora sp. WMMD1102]MDG4792155.1 hypothetical protein [Micromonospora sp. WMMD1102]
MRSRSGAVWVPMWMLLAVLLVVAIRLGFAPVEWWISLVAGPVIGVPAAVVVSFATDKPWASVHRSAVVLAGSVWVAFVAKTGAVQWAAVSLGAVGALFAALEFAVARNRVIVETIPNLPDVDRRPSAVREWEAMLQRLTKTRKKRGEAEEDWEWSQLRVSAVTPWPDRTAGEQVHLDLPEGMTVKDLAGQTDKIAGARRLPAGCVVRVLDGPHQGAAILDVMLRDCLAGDGRRISEPTDKVSIYDEFDIATTARGEKLDVSLREDSMVVGGTTGSGKTTFLHRVIMRMARCVDALIWIVDPNGGGVAAPWIGPWARGEASKPTVDWVAEDEYEAAALVAVATAIVKDRKTSPEATARMRAANTTVLPVDAKLPLILVITDEGGELRQMAGLISKIVDEGIARLAQIGRAQGGRVIMSVLRGTGDLLGKGLRTVASLRLCLRMDEEDEYTYVLGVNPGRARLLHMGSAYVYRTKVDYRPVLARTVDVDIASIERHAIATAHLRPDLDDRGKRVAAGVRVQDVLGGRDADGFPELRRHPVFRDLRDGLVYANRWKRKAAMLAELRGEEVPEDDRPAEPPALERPTVAPIGSATERFLIGTGVTLERQRARAEVTSGVQDRAPDSGMDAEAERLLSEAHLKLDGVPGDRSKPENAREWIELVLRDGYPDMMTAAQVHAQMGEQGVEVSYQRVYDLLKSMAKAGGKVRQEGNRYELVRE